MITTLAHTFSRCLVLLLPLIAVPAGALEVEDGYVRALPPGQSVTAAFFRLNNDSDRPWVLVAAASDAADSVEIHRHQMQEGVMRMREQERVVVPARGELLFAPGGYHLMLLGLQRTLREGEVVSVTLQAQSGERVEVALPVVSVLNEHRRNDHHHGEHGQHTGEHR